MGEVKSLVFIGAHPDDETFGMGGSLAHYVRRGCRVYYVCATRGEAGEAAPRFRQAYATMGDLRWAELTAAARELGLSEVIYLGYRDSGMTGAADNRHPQALINAPPAEVTAKLVQILRRIRPQVVVTFDPIGGYRHPDHIFTHQAAVRAFQAASDAGLFPEAGPAFQPSKLYYGVFPHRFLKLAVKILPLLGKDPHKFGQNRDIDLTQMIEPEFPIHAAVKLTREDLRIRRRATACHASQLEDTTSGQGIFGLFFRLSALINGLRGERDYYMRAYPEPGPRAKMEKDLFAGI